MRELDGEALPDRAPLPWLETASARIYGLVARRAPVCVLFRRGPARHVRLLRWDLRDDAIEPGQWFKGRVYERRCDLSPDGRRLVYFAAKHKGPFDTWTAISRPPWFTALALWPKGDGWAGGGLFSDNDELRLNHPVWRGKTPEESFVLAEGFSLPPGLRVVPLGHCGMGGEDEPILSTRLERDGWEMDAPGVQQAYARTGRFRFPYSSPAIRSRALPRSRGLRLRVHLHGIAETNGRWYVETADLVDRGGAVLRDFGRVDWIDGDRDGNLLLARNGIVSRLDRGTVRDGEPKLVADLNDMAFEAIAAPYGGQGSTARR